MRSSTGPVLWVLVVAFGVLFMLQDTDVFSALQAGQRNLGDVDGRPITQTEYNARVSNFTEQFTRQNGNPPSIEERARFEEIAWEQMVIELALQSEMERLGIDVSDEEIIEAILGDDPDPIIRQIFGRPDGSIDRATLRALIDQPETQADWVMIENQIRENRKQLKINQFMQSAVMVTSREINQDYIRNNTTASVEFVRFPFSDISDSEIEVTDRELRDYHRANSSQFERDKTWRFRYVSFSKEATAQDTLNSKNQLERIRSDFETSVDDSLFVRLNFSTTPYNGSFRSRDEIRDVYHIVFDMEVGEVSAPLVDENQVAIIKKTGRQGDQVRFAKVTRVITADATISDMERQAADFQAFAVMEGFETEAERANLEIRETSATRGAPFVPGIGESRVTLRELEKLSRNNISDLIELDNQFLVIQVLQVTDKGVRPLDEVRQQVENAVRAEKRRQIMFDRVSSQYSNSSSLQELADRAERSVQSASNIRMNSTNISGAGREPGIVGAIFGSETNTLKGPIKGENAVFFFIVTERTDADLANLSSSERERIRTRLTQQKTRTFTEQLVDRLKEQSRVRDLRNRVVMM
ncbi:MAG: SurA N-terminal domain-containing protein [Balneolales bacterium]|nr:SurA N-terminal domain-containing protein [Balneolales bacterium]